MADRQPTMKEAFDDANLNNVMDLLRKLKFGALIQQLALWLIGKDPAASTSQLATLESIPLPDGQKAAAIKFAYSRAGTVTGPLTPVAYGVTPATTQVAVAPNGDIVVLAADAITKLDIAYEPMPKYEVVEVVDVIPAVGVAAIPQKWKDRGVLFLLSAEIVTGTTLGASKVLVPAAGLPATTQARLDVAKDNVQFNNATDAPTKVKFKLAVAPEVSMETLQSATPF